MKRMPFDLLVIFLTIIPLHFASSETLPLTSPTKCHEQERSALLEFKQSFFDAKSSVCRRYGHRPKLESWKLEDRDCCDWEGVDCDEGMGYVTSLDLSESCLSGPINSKASLIRLAHLQSLNLALNDFNYSQIPSAIGDLVELLSLNLSSSSFEGQIPSQVLKLTNLTSLDLSWNGRLELRNPSMETLVQFLTKLEHLNLCRSNVSAPVPDVVANLSSLTSLRLCDCYLQGTFPTTIFKLPRLQLLDLSGNPKPSSHLPEFRLGNPIKSMSLGITNFSGSLPASLGNLAFLSKFNIDQSNFSGNIPSSIGNLTQLTMLNFRLNKLSGEIPSSLGKLIQLSYLNLGMNLLSGEIPASLTNLTNLTSLDLWDNQLTGQIPAEITRLTRLTYLDLSLNRLTGPIPKNISNLESLDYLGLQSNNLNGTLRLDVILKLQHLDKLQLSSNEFSSIIEPGMNTSLPNLSVLSLASSNLSELPIFISYQSRLQWLDLSQNRIYGPTPPWFLNNKLYGVIPPCLSNLSNSLLVLSLNGNDLYGRFPQLQNDVCQLNMIDVSDNQLQGSLPWELANCTNLEFLNIGNNQIVDTFPSWMGSLFYLKVLILRSNRFHGAIGEPKARDQFPNL
ncbi:hypothetical protein EUGRSUZ_B00681 [Eucalyptus grandis]|uniref:Uncharacterized protein n=2 Tax=Eucalyptus grandis TaxID=71139 RepID=A0ACC3LMX8_EUCGR|nr:hypothetical protein EUGRSUZ_B00681 [Eucalyptus grandis]